MFFHWNGVCWFSSTISTWFGVREFKKDRLENFLVNMPCVLELLISIWTRESNDPNPENQNSKKRNDGCFKLGNPQSLMFSRGALYSVLIWSAGEIKDKVGAWKLRVEYLYQFKKVKKIYITITYIYIFLGFLQIKIHFILNPFGQIPTGGLDVLRAVYNLTKLTGGIAVCGHILSSRSCLTTYFPFGILSFSRTMIWQDFYWR